ncbi:hypothetical protein BX666DRAFT_2024155 [Dichotomocladium elegans]|nr:hypothetical protein BX666DRAFT_2024155 [Dichotomocladium elegans]
MFFNTSSRLATRSLARRTYATKHTAETFPEETFNASIWRNTVIAIAAGAAWFKLDQSMTGEEGKHPITKYIESVMTSSSEMDKFNNAKLDEASKLAEYRLIAQDAQRAPIYRMRYPESFERASPRGLVTGAQADLSDLKVRYD